REGAGRDDREGTRQTRRGEGEGHGPEGAREARSRAARDPRHSSGAAARGPPRAQGRTPRGPASEGRGASAAHGARRPCPDHQGRRQLRRLSGASRGDRLAGETARGVVSGSAGVPREQATGHERDLVEWLAPVGQTGRAVLVTAQTDERVGRATANLKEIDIRTPGTLRLADVLRAETVLVLRPALDALAARATVATVERAE